MTKHYNRQELTARRRTLRNNCTGSEYKLWQCLRERQIEGLRFRRQYGIDSYVVDFYCVELKLAIEVDGGQHFEDHYMKRDFTRTKHLNSFGVTCIRFSNRDVINNMEGVLAVIEDTAKRLRRLKYGG